MQLASLKVIDAPGGRATAKIEGVKSVIPGREIADLAPLIMTRPAAPTG